MFREFAQKSGIRGFTYAETNNKLAKLMWYGIMLICAGMTIYDVSGTIRYFMSFPTTTKVKLMNNQSIDFGAPTLSVSYSNTINNLKQFQNGSKEDIYELLGSVIPYYVNNISYDATGDTELFQTALSLIVAVVASVTRAEHYLADKNHPYDYGWGYAILEKQNQTSMVRIRNDGADQVEFAYKWLLANNVSIREAAVVSVKLLCHLFSFTVITDNEMNSDQKCEVITPTWIGIQPGTASGWFEEIISFKIVSQHFTFSSNFEQTDVKFIRPQMYSDQKYSHPHYVSLDFSGDPTILKNSVNVVYQAVDTVCWIQVAVAAQYKQINTLRSLCSSDDYYSLCIFKGRAQMIKELCGCNPIDLAGNLHVDNPCSIDTLKNLAYVNCYNRSATYVSAHFNSNCYQKCDRPTLSFTQGQSLHVLNPNETSMELMVTVFNYPVFEEIPLLEPKQILGSLGGNLSLYLGANFMLLYYTAFYWVTAVLEKVRNTIAVPKEK